MKDRLKPPSPALVISCIALFVAVGGTAYAATSLPANSVGSRQLKKGAVTPRKVAPKTIALFKGQTGPPGPKGGAGPKGDAGPQGPGGSIMTYDASASASPTQTTVGTALGDTWSAKCSIPSAGNAELDLFFKTSNGSFRADDIVIQDDATNDHSTNTVSVNFPVDTFISPTVLDEVTTTTGTLPAASDHEIDIVQLAPQPGYITLHLHAEATTAPASQTCHLSIQSIPETISAAVQG